MADQGDLSDLFARLRSPQSQQSASHPVTSMGANQSASGAYHEPFVSSPIISPPPQNSEPKNASDVISPNTSAMNTPMPESGADPRANLLNLLRFNQNSQAAQAAQATNSMGRQTPQAPVHASQPELQSPVARPIATADLVATLMRKPSASSVVQSPPVTSPAPSLRGVGDTSSSTEAPQDLLLRLLNQGRSTQKQQPASKRLSEPAVAPMGNVETKVDDLARDLADASLEKVSSNPKEGKASPARVFGGRESKESTPFEPDVPQMSRSTQASKPVFTAVNPFEQLQASTPRHHTPKPVSRSGTPRTESAKRSKEAPNDADVVASIEEPKASKRRALNPEATVHVKASAIASLGQESVSEALEEVGEQVNKQVEEALAQADTATNGHATLAKRPSPEEVVQAVKDTVTEIKQELEDDPKALEKVMPAPVAEATKEVVDEITQGDVADSWESADAQDSAKDEEAVVTVYNLPMKPFVSIDIKTLKEPAISFRQEIVLDVARLKKEFDQIDRNLVAASKNFILYAIARNGGMRLIRQDNGDYKQLFSTQKERIYNLSICNASLTSPNSDEEGLLGTGVNGTVFWTKVAGNDSTRFNQGKPEDQGFIFPSPASQEENNTSGGTLKTRAKKSNRHPEWFAIGRGKAIWFIWPSVAASDAYTDSATRICDSDRYLGDRSLVVHIGKASKDFSFSECDTVMATLDKTGKMSFWDIRQFSEERFGNNDGKIPPVLVTDPLLTYTTTSPTDKSWPTSLMFVDKDRPFVRALALRYLIVGMKQNHTLQLWDLGLAKPVQEINFPHENESDAICSIAYHAKTGIIAVGHPTRNSIYFIHLSAPRYNLPAMNQARFISRLAQMDPTLPKPESTAIMSGVREYSFASKGQLRSLDILTDPAAPGGGSNSSAAYDPGDEPLFELYVMHSKGVTCLGIRKSDLGWTKENKVINPIEAEKTGDVVVSPLRAMAPPSSRSSANGDTASQAPSTRSTLREVKKENKTPSRALSPQQSQTSEMIASTLARVENKQDVERAAIINGTDKGAEKRKKKRSAGDTASQVSSTAPAPSTPSANPPLLTPASYAQAASQSRSPAMETPEPKQLTSESKAAPKLPAKQDTDEPPAWATRLISNMNGQPAAAAVQTNLEPHFDQLAKRVSADFASSFKSQIDSLYKLVDEDRRVQEATGAAKQDAMLRLVSSTLTENVEKTLSRIVANNVSTVILPELSNVIASTLDRRLNESLAGALQTSVPAQIKSALPQAISRSMQDPQMLRELTNNVSMHVSGHVDKHLGDSMQNLMTPLFNNFGSHTVRQISGEVEKRLSEGMRIQEMQRQHDSAKIDQLTTLVQSLTGTIQTMSAAQVDLQAEVSKLQGLLTRQESSQPPPSTVGSGASAPAKSPEEVELETIAGLMKDGEYEQGTIMWLQSQRQAELFDSYFVRWNPGFIQQLAPLVSLSVGAAVTASLDTNVEERLTWLEASLNSIDTSQPDIIEVAPKIMEVLRQRLLQAYMQINQTHPRNPVVQRLPNILREVDAIKTAAFAAAERGH